MDGQRRGHRFAIIERQRQVNERVELVAAFLASAAAAITGETIYVDNGYHVMGM